MPPDPAAETLVLVLLFLATILAAGFIVVYAVDAIPDKTQLLGATLGSSLVCIAAALVIVSADDEMAAAQALVSRKLRMMRDLPRDVATRRLVGMLGRKGFGSGLAYRVVAEALSDEAIAVSRS